VVFNEKMVASLQNLDNFTYLQTYFPSEPDFLFSNTPANDFSTICQKFLKFSLNLTIKLSIYKNKFIYFRKNVVSNKIRLSELNAITTTILLS
jgi:hypothetical protein